MPLRMLALILRTGKDLELDSRRALKIKGGTYHDFVISASSMKSKVENKVSDAKEKAAKAVNK